MDPLRVLCEAHGFFTRAETYEFGYDHKAIARAVRTKVWHRIRHGVYTYTDLWSSMDPVQRHRIRSRAVLRSLGSKVALSHVSGVIDWEIPVWNVDLSRVHVTRLDGGAGRIEGDVVHHEGFCVDQDVHERDGHLVLAPERCVLEAGSRSEPAPALVIADGLLRLGLATPDRLSDQFALMERWPFMRSMQLTVRMADGRSMSVGESVGRHVMWSAHVPAPQLQYEVHDADGRLVGTCDWGWPEHELLGEFDGLIKYGRLLKPGQEAGDVVFAEKVREDQLREITGFRMIRLIWDDYQRPRLTARRLEQQLRRPGRPA